MHRSILILLLIAATLRWPTAHGQVPDVASPLVSYQFLDSLSDVPDQPNVVSPLVSYQYFDWLGDENVDFTNSPLVSYYFGGGVSLALSGIVRDANGLPIPGAEVILQRYNTVFWHGYTAADGTIPAPNLPAGNFNVVVIKTGYTSLFQSVPGDVGGPLSINLTLHPALALPDLVTVSRTPDETAIRPKDPETVPGVRAANLRVFNGSAFSPLGSINPNRMTIVITHGWDSSLDDWATLMAGYILSNHSLETEIPNIVGWDWRQRAIGDQPPIDEAIPQGENLGKALYDELEAGYGGRIHFIGHSLGTIVNAYACDYLHGRLPRQNHPVIPWNETLTRPHVTLFDEAELANVYGTNAFYSTWGAWNDAEARAQLFAFANGTNSPGAPSGLKSPVPASAVWCDSFISAVAPLRNDTVNIILAYKPNAISHQLSHQWYRDSIRFSAQNHPMGYSRTYEKSLVFPPSGPGTSRGSLWKRTDGSVDPFSLEQADPSILDQFRSDFIRSTAFTVAPVANIGLAVLDQYKMGLNWVGDLGESVIQKTGSVTSSTSEKVGNWWDSALDKASTINPDTLFTGSIGLPSLKLLFNTSAPGASPLSSGFRGLNSPTAATPPQAWVPVRIPAGAAFLVFDFTVTGDPADDLIVCAINEKNLFTLPARFAPDNSPVSTDFLDVSAYAGQQVELYFGLVGCTSSGCILAIDGIRFVTIPTPKLAVTAVGAQVRLQWPAAATGWIPQRNSSLEPENWEDVTLPETITAINGVVTLERSRLPGKEFFRLRRVD